MNRVDAAGTRDGWRNAVVDQMYVRSFADANGDGTGDIAGIRSNLAYPANRADLGIDAIWVHPALALRRDVLTGDSKIRMLDLGTDVVAFERGTGLSCAVWLVVGDAVIAWLARCSTGTAEWDVRLYRRCRRCPSVE